MSRSLIVLLCLLFQFMYVNGEDGLTADNLRTLLPEKPGDSWETKGAPQEYKGDDLFLYINGGAEIYHEYGFERVIVQDYINSSDKTIILELYQMEDPESAYGIYSFKTTPQGRNLDIGAHGLLEDYYLNFWKGRFLATLTGFDESEQTLKGLEIIARGLDARLPDESRIPSLVSLLPPDGLIETGISYYEGRLGLANSRSFFPEDIFQIRKGVRGDYEDKSSVFIFQYKDVQKCGEIFDSVKAEFENSPDYKLVSQQDILQVTDSEGSDIRVNCISKYLVLITGPISSEKAETIFSRISKNIK